MITVTGSDGRLATALRNRVGEDHNYTWASRRNFDITDCTAVCNYFIDNPSDLTVHLAAYTATSRADKEREKCYLANVVGTRNVACFSRKMIYVSTDHVFSGSKGDYKEQDEPCPWNHYGWTKLMGEKETWRCHSLIIRCTFRARPFPYPVAWNDSLTTCLWVEEMAEALQWCIENFDNLPPILHIGGKKQDYYSFAKEDHVSSGSAPLEFPRDLSLDSSLYRRLRWGGAAGIHCSQTSGMK